MANLKDIFKLCKKENGRLIFLDEEGDISYVLLSAERYQAFTPAKEQVEERVEKPKLPDPEEINRKIVEAQLSEPSAPKPLEPAPEHLHRQTESEPRPKMVTDSLHIGNVLQERLKQWPKNYSVPQVHTQGNGNGNNEETIDPSFDFEGPKLSIEDI